MTSHARSLGRKRMVVQKCTVNRAFL